MNKATGPGHGCARSTHSLNTHYTTGGKDKAAEKEGGSHMNFNLYTARCTGSKTNCLYPDRREIHCAEDLSYAVKQDHVCAQYKKNHRREENFITSDVVVMDCDNDHSDNPTEWITPEKLADMLPDVAFAWAPSRHNNLPKGEACARPRGHVYFPIGPVTDPKQYAAIKQRIFRTYPFFDGNALDAARFLFGAETGEITWYDRWGYIDDMLPATSGAENEEPVIGSEEKTNRPQVTDLFAAGKRHNQNHLPGLYPVPERKETIPEGERNTTLHRYATRVLKRFGDGEQAQQLFLQEAERCDPPLGDEELNNIWSSALRFFDTKVAGQEDYISSEEYSQDFTVFSQHSLKPEDYSDIGEGRALVKEFGHELLFTKETEWLRFDGQKWVENDRLAITAVKELLDMQLAEAMQQEEQAKEWLSTLGVSETGITSGKKNSSKLPIGAERALQVLQSAQTYRKFVEKRRNMPYIGYTLEAAESDLFASVNDMDVEGFLLNTPGRTFDLRNGLEGGREPRAEDHITKSTLCAPGNEGAELWQQTLQTIFCGDAALIDYVQQIVGLAAIGKVYQEALIIAYGGGRNGKSTFWNTIRRVLGDYSGSLPAEILTVSKNLPNIPAQLAELKGDRLVIAAELEEGLRLSTSMLKQLCSTDEINACKKYKDPFDFTPSHTLVLYTNHLPKVGALDAGTWRRLIVIPFTAKLEGNGDILNYADFLVTNAAPAVMKWIIEGAEKIIARNFHPDMPESVKAAIEEYRGKNNWLDQFLEECCDVGETCTVRSSELYAAYRMYCNRTGYWTHSNSDFVEVLENAGFERMRNKKGVTVKGVALKSEFAA